MTGEEWWVRMADDPTLNGPFTITDAFEFGRTHYQLGDAQIIRFVNGEPVVCAATNSNDLL